PLRRVATVPISLSVSMCSALMQQVSKLRSDANVTLISSLRGERQQWSDGARAAGKQVVDIGHRRGCGNLVRQLAGALETIAAIQPPMRQHKIGPDLRAKSDIRAGRRGPDLQPFASQTFPLGLSQVQRMQRRRKQPVKFRDGIGAPSSGFAQISAKQQRES